MEIKIVDIFWDRIYLNVVFEGENIEKSEIFLKTKSQAVKLDVEKIEKSNEAKLKNTELKKLDLAEEQDIKLTDCKMQQTNTGIRYKSVINITNIENIVMLKNGNYKFIVKQEDESKEIEITTEVGYKLKNLDKIYRYSKENLAYTVSFKPRGKDGKIYCTLVSRYMIINHNYRKEQIRGTRKKARRAMFIFGKNCFNAFYKVLAFIHFNKKNKILLMSETRSPMGGNLKALDDRIKERGLNGNLKNSINLEKNNKEDINKQTTKKLQTNKKDKVKLKITYSFFKTLENSTLKIALHYLKLTWQLSKQELVFVDDYCPIFKFINLSPETKLVQLWHAGVGFKSVGYARFGFSGPYPYTSCHRRYDYAIVGGEALVPVYAEVFGINKEKILPYGLPRLDNFLDSDKIKETKEKLYNNYTNLKEKKCILFAPTFRGTGQKTANYPFEKLDLDAIYNLCKKENYMFLIKMHPFVRKRINIPEEYKEYIIDFSDYPDINELLYITDILITDYSSNIYDFSLLNRPIIFYTYDLDYYQIINKVHRPIREYAPGKVCTTFNEVIETIENKDFEMKKLERFREENFSIHNKTASDMIIDNIILKHINDD